MKGLVDDEVEERGERGGEISRYEEDSPSMVELIVLTMLALMDCCSEGIEIRSY